MSRTDERLKIQGEPERWSEGTCRGCKDLTLIFYGYCGECRDKREAKTAARRKLIEAKVAAHERDQQRYAEQREAREEAIRRYDSIPRCYIRECGGQAVTNPEFKHQYCAWHWFVNNGHYYVGLGGGGRGLNIENPKALWSVLLDAYEKQNATCPITGAVLQIGRNTKPVRLDRTKPVELDNVVWVHEFIGAAVYRLGLKGATEFLLSVADRLEPKSAEFAATT